MNRFKVGDRVVCPAVFWIKSTGTVVEDCEGSNIVKVVWDNHKHPNSFYDKTHVFSMVNNGEIVLESVYNSSLYKLMQENT